MNWFAWRQHRKQFLIFGILLVAFAALIIPTGIHFWDTYQQTLATCAHNPATPSCSDVDGSLFQTTIDQLLFHLLPLVVLFLPLLLGMFWGAPLLAREYTEGTNNLAWTQSVSRRKWLTVKFTWILAATVVLVGISAALLTWWSKTPNTINMNRFSNQMSFITQGIVPVAFGLFVVSFGIMFGAWFRKTMIAAGVLLGLFFVVSIAVPNFVRPYYVAPIAVTAPMGPNAFGSKIPNGSWIVSQNIVDKNGKTFLRFDLPNFPSQCQQLIQQSAGVTNNGGAVHVKVAVSGNGGDPVDACLNNAGYHQVAKYQPSYRYWDFQRIESGIYLGLAVLAVGATYWLILKRDA